MSHVSVCVSVCVWDPQIVKVWSEDGAGKVVEIPADMTSRDMCQPLVYRSHCLDDNCWSLVEHHPLLGLGTSMDVCVCVCCVCVFCMLCVVYYRREREILRERE